MSSGQHPVYRVRIPMRRRGPEEEHRAATPLELLFDLVFVVAVAQAATAFHHSLTHGDVGKGLVSFCLVFFAIAWAWINFTWFASAFDTDDVPYRLLTFLQMAGVLVLATGVDTAFDDRNMAYCVAGYVVMRVALILQWLRVSREVPEVRALAVRQAVGYGVIQAYWVVMLFLPQGFLIPMFIVGGIAEMMVPVVAGWNMAGMAYHPHHVAERYGLFTIIVIGESVTAATVAMKEAWTTENDTRVISMIAVSVAAMLLLFAVWWIYFEYNDHTPSLSGPPWTFIWGYGHIILLGAIAAMGAGVQVVAEAVTKPEEVHLSDLGVSLSVAVPVAVFLFCLAGFPKTDKIVFGRSSVLLAGFGVVCLAFGFLGAAIPPKDVLIAVGLTLVVLVVYGTLRARGKDLPAAH